MRRKVHSMDEAQRVKHHLYTEGSKDKSSPGLVLDNPQEIRKGEDQFPVEQEQAGTYEFQRARVCGIHHGRVKRKWIVEA